MTFFKKLTQVVSNTADAITNKTTELKQVYEKEQWSGLLSVAEKNLETLSDNTTEYFDNIKRANEKVIHDTAKNANSSLEAILKSTFAVSKETFTFVAKDLKVQALKIYKAWEDMEVEKSFSPELNLLYQATSVLSPEDLMAYCGAERDGAIHTMNGIQVEIYGQIWLILGQEDKQNKGSLPLLQYIVVNSTKETMSDEFLLRNCLSVMFKIPEVSAEYERLYAEYLAANPHIEALASPFDVREVVVSENAQAPNELVAKVKDASAQYLQTGKDVVSNLANKYKAATTPSETVAESNAIADEAVDDLKKFTTAQSTVLEGESPEIVKLREELRQAHAKLTLLQASSETPADVVVPERNLSATPQSVAVAVKTAAKKTKSVKDESSAVAVTEEKKKPATKRAPKAESVKAETAPKKPATKKAPAAKKTATTASESAPKTTRAKKDVQKDSEK